MKGIADLLDTDMEDTADLIDEDSILSSASDAAASKTTKARKSKPRHRVTMPPKSKSKVQKSASGQSKKSSAKQVAPAKRVALEDHINTQVATEDDLVEASGAELPVSPPRPKKNSRATTKATKKATTAKEPPEAEDDLMLVEQSPIIVRSKQAAGRSNTAPKVAKRATAASRPKAAQRARSPDTEMPEVEVDQTGPESDVAPKEPLPKRETSTRDASRTRPDPIYRRRAGSASENERSDPNLRRKLGDVTRKFENVDLKYRNLKEVGINEANANMDKLRKQCDVTMQASNELIVSLKKELAMQAPLAQEARKLQKQMQTQEMEVSRMRETAAELASSLHTAENEIKALQAKLAAARTSSLDDANPKAPPSAMKTKSQRPAMIGNAEAAQTAQYAQMKEDLYSDLTGLIIRAVKKTDEGDTYDCIQTGRNGSK